MNIKGIQSVDVSCIALLESPFYQHQPGPGYNFPQFRAIFSHGSPLLPWRKNAENAAQLESLERRKLPRIGVEFPANPACLKKYLKVYINILWWMSIIPRYPNICVGWVPSKNPQLGDPSHFFVSSIFISEKCDPERLRLLAQDCGRDATGGSHFCKLHAPGPGFPEAPGI